MRAPRSAARQGDRARRGANGNVVASQTADIVKQAGLRYVDDSGPGIRRKRAGKSFSYTGARGRRVTDEAELRRIAKLAIPPAWTDVWICPQANGHIQATGRDARGRKQYRYHEDWRTARDATKYERMVEFGHALPRIRRNVAKDLRHAGLPREKALAVIVQLLQRTLMRVGNEEYARENGTFGLSTLRDRHVKVRPGKLEFKFTGKSGKKHEIDLRDARLARIVGQLQDLPGQDLFQYMADDGARQKITSDDVNEYIRHAAGADFTAKDFRTWSGTVLAALYLAACTGAGGRATKKNLTGAVKNVATLLGNTPAVCRKSYIHPAVLDGFMRGEVIKAVQREPEKAPVANSGLSAEEKAVLAFLEKKLKQPKRNLRELLKASLK